MIDLDFIANEKPTLRKSCVYIYSSGIFRRDVFEKIKGKYGEYRKVEVSALRSLLEIPSLFSQRLFVCEVNSIDDLMEIEICIPKIKEDRLFVAVDKERYVKELEFAQKIEEVSKGKGAFTPLFTYLCNKCGITDNILEKNPLLKQNIEELYSKCPDLLVYMQKAEFVLFSCLDSTTWNSSLFRSLLPKVETTHYFKLHECVYFFLQNLTPTSKELLFQHIDNEISAGMEPRQCVAALYRVYFDLCAANKYYCKDPGIDFKAKQMKKFAELNVLKLMQYMLFLARHELDMTQGDFLPVFETSLQELYLYLKD